MNGVQATQQPSPTPQQPLADIEPLDWIHLLYEGSSVTPGYIEFRLLRKPKIEKHWMPYPALPGHPDIKTLGDVRRWQDKDWNVYYGVSLRVEEGVSGDEGVHPTPLVWQDLDLKSASGYLLDGANVEQMTPEALYTAKVRLYAELMRRCVELDLLPLVVVNSGHGLQVLWRRRAGSTTQDTENFNKALYEEFKDLGADRSTRNPERILRLPSGFNLKNPTRRLPVEIWHLNPLQTVDDAVLMALVKSEPGRPVPPALTVTSSSKPTSGAAWAERAAQRRRADVEAAVKGEAAIMAGTTKLRNDQLNISAMKLGRFLPYHELGEVDLINALACAARAAGLDEGEIIPTIRSGISKGIKEPADPQRFDREEQEKETARQSRRSSGGTQLGASGLPEIVVNERQLREIAADTEAALLASNKPPTLFHRGGELVRLAADEGGLRLRTVDVVALKGRLARVADFVTLIERTRQDEDGKRQVVTDSKPARPPADLAPDLLARSEHLGLPPLRTLAKSPIYAPGGALVSVEGYHAPSGIYLALRGLTVPRLPTVPDALALLRELLADFPFSPREAGFAHTLAALLLPFVRPMIDGPTPLHLIEAPTRGSGKGLLSEVIAHVTVGGPAGVMVQPKDGDEFEKRVTSILLEGAPVVLIDNVNTLKGEAMAAALTSSLWRGRRLGKSEMLTLPNGALWMATGNNVNLDDDMPRRIIPIRLDPGVERPEERTGFRHPDLLAYTLAHRPALVAACLSLVEAWKAEGRPSGPARLGSFESWAAIIGGILDVAGVPGFLTAREGLYETANAEPQEWAALLTALHGVHGSESIGARDVLAVMRAHDLCSDYWESRQASSALRRVGRAVTQRRDRVFGGYRLRLAGKTATGNTAYRVDPSGQGQKKTPETPKTPEGLVETVSSTEFAENAVLRETPGVSGVFAENTGETPEKHRVLEVVPDDAEGVSGVSGVFSPPDSDGEDAVEL